MKEKTWDFRYKDVVKVTEEYDVVFEKIVENKTAEHLPLDGDFVITHDKEDETIRFIHSDIKISGLELLKENTTIEEEN